MRWIKTLMVMVGLSALVLQSANSESLTGNDLNFAFKTQSSTAAAQQLSKDEMQKTKGEWVPLAIAAGRVAYSGYRAYRAGKAAKNSMKAYKSTKRFAGSRKTWVRYGNSYSKSGKFNTKSLRWGSNSRYNKDIRNKSLRNLNKRLRNYKIPGKSWRTRDPGHFHIRRR